MSRAIIINCACIFLLLITSMTFSATPVLLPGWPPAIGNRPILSSICLADIDGDGVQDVIAGTYGEEPSPYGNGMICVWDGEGNYLPGFPAVTSGPVPATPSAADLDLDGEMEIVAGSWNYLYVFEHDGSYHQGWPKSYSISNTAAIENMDSDGALEIIFCSSGTVRIADHDGSIISTRSLGGNLSNPAVGDVDHDSDMEVVVQTSNKLVYVLEKDLSDSPGWPKTVTGETWMNNRSPALGDLDGDGYLEILADTGSLLYAFRYNGNIMTGWPQTVYKYANNMPVCLDMDDNGDLEILSAKNDMGGNRIYVFQHDGTNFGAWPLDTSMQPESNPVAGDIDGDGLMELVLNFYDYLGAFNHDKTTVSGFPVALPDYSHTGTISPCPALGDINGDGILDIVAASNFKDVNAFTLYKGYHAPLLEWSMFAHDPCHTARYASPDNNKAFAYWIEPPESVKPQTSVSLRMCYVNNTANTVVFSGVFKVYLTLNGQLIKTKTHPNVTVNSSSEKIMTYKTLIPGSALGRQLRICDDGQVNGNAYLSCFIVDVNP